MKARNSRNAKTLGAREAGVVASRKGFIQMGMKIKSTVYPAGHPKAPISVDLKALKESPPKPRGNREPMLSVRRRGLPERRFMNLSAGMGFRF
jgi:hypothetical protein